MPEKLITVERPPVDVIHGSKTERVNTTWHPDKDRAEREGRARSEKDSQSSASDNGGQAEQR